MDHSWWARSQQVSALKARLGCAENGFICIIHSLLYTSKPCFHSLILSLWWPHCMNISWEWSVLLVGQPSMQLTTTVKAIWVVSLGRLVGKSARLVSERLRVWILAGAVGEFYSPELAFVRWLLFDVCSTPVLLQWHIKDPCHSAKSAGGRLHLNTHTPFTQPSRNGLTMPLCRHSVGIYQERGSHTIHQETLSHSHLSLLSPCGLILA